MAFAITVRVTVPEHFLDVREQRAGFVLIVAFLISFLFIRTSARLMRSPRVPWWPGSVKTSGGVHLHHLVWGIVLVLLAGFLSFVTKAVSPWQEILAAMFGIGAGLTLDEFALWVHLRDVYWADEGRSSFDAVVVAALIGALIVVGASPFDLPNNASSVGTLAIAIAIDVLLSLVAILKGKPLMGLVGIFIPLLSLIAALRLASPSSPWARRWYREKKLARAAARWQRIRARRRRLVDAVLGPAGSPAVAEDKDPR